MAGSGERSLKLDIRLLGFQRPARPTSESLARAAFADTRKQAEDYEWIRLRLAVESLGPQTGPLSGESFVAIDSRDQRYPGVDVDPGGIFEPDLTGQSLEVGDRLQGFVAIPVPRPVRVVAVRYSSVSGGRSVQWRIPARANRAPLSRSAGAGSPVPMWPSGMDGYTVVLQSTADRETAETAARQLIRGGADAGLLRSDGYRTFPPRQWIVWRGRYEDEATAREALQRVIARVPSAQVQLVEPR